jgi:hypothetical protein
MWYLHKEVIASVPRKYNVTRASMLRLVDGFHGCRWGCREKANTCEHCWWIDSLWMLMIGWLVFSTNPNMFIIVHTDSYCVVMQMYCVSCQKGSFPRQRSIVQDISRLNLSNSRIVLSALLNEIQDDASISEINWIIWIIYSTQLSVSTVKEDSHNMSQRTLRTEKRPPTAETKYGEDSVPRSGTHQCIE